MDIFLIVVYSSALLFIFLYSIVQANLTFLYLRGRKKGKKGPTLELKDLKDEEDQLPFVTIQLPIFNEMYVIERLIDAVAAFEYPKDRYEVQVLDDSTDETIDIVAKKVEAVREQGIDIKQVLREDRKGFKAGALQYGMKSAKGDYIVIFDADFLPSPNFLEKTLPWFDDPKIGVVQTRWEHINKDYSILTKLQAFALDAHFSVEQKGRNYGDHFINFNGTAGVWRRETIDDAGGWQADTLTEDLDLSYRAQLKGWKFIFREEIGSPAELPAAMDAIKSQQFRWTKGAAETARKNLGRVFRSDLPFKTKLHAFFHLMNSGIFISILMLGLVSVPILFLNYQDKRFDLLFDISSLALINTVILAIFFWASRTRRRKEEDENPIRFFLMFPVFLSVSMGLALHNAIAVIEGYIGRKTPFIRTPKFAIKSGKDDWEGKKYTTSRISFLTLVEGLLMLYFLGGLVMTLLKGDFVSSPFMLMLTFGYGTIFFYSVRHARRAA